MTTRIDWEEFEKQFKPVKNHIDDNASWNGFMFETFGEELVFVTDMDRAGHNAFKVWTVIDCEYEEDFDGENVDYSGGPTLVSGLRYVNRLGYLVCEVPTEGEYEVID